MFSFNNVTRYIIKVIAIYILLIAIGSIPIVRNVNAQLFRNIFSVTLKTVATHGNVQYNPSTQQGFDTQLLITNQQQIQAALQSGMTTVKAAQINIQTWVFASVPIIFLWALIMAMPTPVRKKNQHILLGTMLMLLFIYIKMLCRIYYELNLPINASTLAGLGKVGTSTQNLLTQFYNIFILIGSNLFVAIAICLLISAKYLRIT
ncbi:MAG: hypothetical protein KA974_04985 [Saprospiraceae bacterium]|nr:hypothetical protein [Saprospiraceae bacterium]MBP7699781.1 hypothetical protein [Saprospiraceae bacterium]